MDSLTPEPLVVAGYSSWCQALGQGKMQALQLLALDDLFMQSCTFDPRTGEGRYNDLDHFLDQVREALLQPRQLDRLSWILQYALPSLQHLLRGVREELVREHQMLPLQQVRQTDSSSLMWLSRQQGRTLKEKLSGKLQMMAPVRVWTIDTAENRLLKVFVEQLSELSEAKAAALGSADDFYEQVAAQITRWLASDEVRSMRRWANLPPNNVLLADKYYRKVWDSWGWLRNLDDAYQVTESMLQDRLLQAVFWVMAAALHELRSVRLFQLPCVFSMPRFTVAPVWPQSFGIAKSTLRLDGFWGRERFSLEVDLGQVIFASQEYQCIVRVATSGLVMQFTGKDALRLSAGTDLLQQLRDNFVSTLNTIQSSSLRKPRQEAAGEQARIGLVDLSLMRPHYALINDEPQAEKELPYRLLGQFCQSGKCGRVLLDCSITEGLLLTSETPVLSSYDLFSGERSEHEMFAASQLFFRKLHETLRCTQAFYYLVPDEADEIALSTVRRQLNLYFPNAQPLPRSIATVFALLKSCPNIFAGQNQVMVMCASLFGTQLVITPLIGTRERELQTRLPQAGGMLWERYPSNVYSPFHKLTDKILPNNMSRQAYKQMSFALADIPVLEYVCVSYAEHDCASDLSACFFGKNRVQQLRSHLASVPLDVQKFFADIQQQVQIKRNMPVFFISADGDLTLQASELGVRNLGGFSPVSGGAQLISWQQQPNCPDLWKDHLPELFMRASFKGTKSYVPLVRSSKAVLPHFGECLTVSLVKFPLSPGNHLYHFPLTRREKGKNLKYEIQIESPVFPLTEELPCVLEVRYTYGAEQPYQLLVKPQSGYRAPFRQIEAQWVSAEHRVRNSPVPQLPAKKTWDDLRHLPKAEGKSDSDVIDWMSREFVKIHEICSGYQELRASTRVEVQGFSSKVRHKSGQDFGFVTLNDGREVFCHKNQYTGQGSLFDASAVYFFVRDGGKGLRANDITDNPQAKTKTEQSLEKRNGDLRKSIRYPSVQVWGEGRSVTDADAPVSLRSAVATFAQDWRTIVDLGMQDSDLGQEYMLCAARMHKDAAWFSSMWARLEQVATGQEKPNAQDMKMLGDALGDLSLPEQQSLHENLLQKHGGWRLSVLANAYWRCPDIVSKLTAEQTQALGNAVRRDLQHQLSTAASNKKLSPFIVTRLCELLLALLRTRGSPDPQIKQILDANGKLASQLIEQVENLQQYYQQHPFAMKTFVRLNLQKPEHLQAMPDLLYAVYTYLSGDDGADDIVITAIVNEE